MRDGLKKLILKKFVINNPPMFTHSQIFYFNDLIFQNEEANRNTIDYSNIFNWTNF